MIMSFRHKGLRRFFEHGEKQGLRPDVVARLERVLGVLNLARGPEDVAVPALRLHPLKGDMEGTWSVWVNANWRVTFRFCRGDVTEVDFVDYH